MAPSNSKNWALIVIVLTSIISIAAILVIFGLNKDKVVDISLGVEEERTHNDELSFPSGPAKYLVRMGMYQMVGEGEEGMKVTYEDGHTDVWRQFMPHWPSTFLLGEERQIAYRPTEEVTLMLEIHFVKDITELEKELGEWVTLDGAVMSKQEGNSFFPIQYQNHYARMYEITPVEDIVTINILGLSPIKLVPIETSLTYQVFDQQGSELIPIQEDTDSLKGSFIPLSEPTKITVRFSEDMVHEGRVGQQIAGEHGVWISQREYQREIRFRSGSEEWFYLEKPVFSLRGNYIDNEQERRITFTKQN